MKITKNQLRQIIKEAMHPQLPPHGKRSNQMTMSGQDIYDKTYAQLKDLVDARLQREEPLDDIAFEAIIDALNDVTDTVVEKARAMTGLNFKRL
jgi:Spy/CpxP family protein refolding chaperone